MKSKFRKLFWVRVGMGFLVFLLVFYYCLDSLLRNTVHIMILPAFIVLIFLIYMSSGLFKIYALTVLENGIELQMLLSRQKHFTPFDAIHCLEYEKVRYRNRQGHVSDGHKMCYLKFKNGERFLISPDTFENYEELLSAIKYHLNELN